MNNILTKEELNDGSYTTKTKRTINVLLDALADEVKYCIKHDLGTSEESIRLLEHFGKYPENEIENE